MIHTLKLIAFTAILIIGLPVKSLNKKWIVINNNRLKNYVALGIVTIIALLAG